MWQRATVPAWVLLAGSAFNKHGHGATSTTGVTHMAIQQMLDGKNVDWLEPVSNAQYDASL
ncbi:hypothetical protein FX982_02914 [Pseudomonas graminis]|uniref:Uncharacterized protein n=1 Tax=Pseudomonas graminis TaxID=158627 RepID=A0A6M8MAZ9_9PSED|nr:hypothetical protein FX982_02914 [Pseudomonas graminis]